MKEIEETKFMLHEAFCTRSNKYCPDCNEAFHIAEYDEHLKNHNNKNQKEIKNSSDNQNTNTQTTKITNDNSNLHRIQSNRIDCNYCGLQISESEKKEHESMCGARSEICEYCNQKFLVKQMKTHLDKCNAKLLIEQNNFIDDEIVDPDSIYYKLFLYLYLY